MLASTAPLFPRQSKAAIHLVVEVSVRNENMGQFLERAKLLQPRQFSEHMLKIICPNDAETTKKLLMMYHGKVKLDDQPKTAQEFYGELRWLKCLGGDALVREEVKRVVIALIKSMAKNLNPNHHVGKNEGRKLVEALTCINDFPNACELVTDDDIVAAASPIIVRLLSVPRAAALRNDRRSLLFEAEVAEPPAVHRVVHARSLEVLRIVSAPGNTSQEHDRHVCIHR